MVDPWFTVHPGGKEICLDRIIYLELKQKVKSFLSKFGFSFSIAVNLTHVIIIAFVFGLLFMKHRGWPIICLHISVVGPLNAYFLIFELIPCHVHLKFSYFAFLRQNFEQKSSHTQKSYSTPSFLYPPLLI